MVERVHSSRQLVELCDRALAAAGQLKKARNVAEQGTPSYILRETIKVISKEKGKILNVDELISRIISQLRSGVLRIIAEEHRLEEDESHAIQLMVDLKNYGDSLQERELPDAVIPLLNELKSLAEKDIDLSKAISRAEEELRKLVHAAEKKEG